VEFLCECFASVRLDRINQSAPFKTNFEWRYYLWYLNDIK
jgi:hypothetical protein